MTKKLPPGWVWISVHDLVATPADITDGPFGSNLKTAHYTESGPRVIRLQNIGDGTFIDEDAHISEAHFHRLHKHEAKSGDVVVAMLGDQLPRACLVPRGLGPAIVKADCVRLRPNALIADPKFVAAGLNSIALRQQAEALLHGVGRPRLGLKWFRTLRFPLAPLPEQHRIVDALDSYCSRLDDASVNLKRAQARLTAYRASVLKAAVEGHLVPTEAELALAENRDYEPADVLLKRILVERRRRWEEAELTNFEVSGKMPKDDKWKTKYDDPEGLDTTGLTELPAGWCWARAESLWWDAGYGTSEKCSSDGNGPAVLRIPNVVGGRVTLDDLKFANDVSSLVPNGEVVPGDFLFIRTNGSPSLIGRAALVVSEYSSAHYFASYLVRLRLVNLDETAAWFALAWQGPTVREQVLKVAASSAGQHNISLTAASNFILPIPPAAEQTRILAEVSRLMAVTEKAEAEISANLQRSDRLRQSILKWAFEGQLVDQDPNDGPAEKLIGRIRAEPAPSALCKESRAGKVMTGS